MIQKSRRLLAIIILAGTLFCIVSIGYGNENDVKFAVISDHKADCYSLQKALTFINDQQVDFIIVSGDFSPLYKMYTDYYVASGYEVNIKKETDEQKVYFVLGNHDSPPYGDAFFRENVALCYPNNGPNSAPRGTIFSFDRGRTHFVITNQYWNDEKGGYTDEQLGWIKQDLQSSQQDFKFVFGHEPAFPLDRHTGDSLDVDPEMRDVFWETLSNQGVDAYFCAHTHRMSVTKKQGVYQIDSGEAASKHISVVIIEVNNQGAMARLFETEGEVPEPTENIVFSNRLIKSDNGDRTLNILFNSDYEEKANSPSCFVRTATDY